MIFDQEYTKLCSEKTLQSEKQGFFLQFAESVSEDVGEKWIKHVFGKLQTDRERIQKIYEDEKINKHVINFLANVREVYRKKCNEFAGKKILEAEQALMVGEKKKALNLLSQSMLKVSLKDETFILALLVRAKTLISLNHFNEALSDLRLAMKEKITDQQKFEALWMMSLCYKSLNEDNKCRVAINLAEKLVGNDQKSLELLRRNMTIKPEPITPKVVKTVPPIKLSEKITIKQSPETGRYAVANEKISIDETLIVEEPIVSYLLPEKFGTHCHHCFDRFLAPLGCPNCASVVFCGPKCRDEAVSTYHKYECKFLDLLIGSGASVLSLTALRAVTQKGSSNTKKLEELCTNADKRTPRDFLQRTLMAAFLLRTLQKSGFFGAKISSVAPTTENEFITGEKILKYLQILQFNAHEIYETLYSTDHKVTVGRPVYIGVGVYPNVALLNHSCYPSVARYFAGKSIVIKSIKPVNKSEEISENYGLIFTHRKLVDRQRVLFSRYWFKCQCKACNEDWPTLSDIKRVRCPTDKCDALFTIPTQTTKCIKCHQKVNLNKNIKMLEWCESQYEVGSGCIQNNEIEMGVKILSEALEIFHRVSVPPYHPSHLAEQALRICYADYGNTHDCLIPKK